MSTNVEEQLPAVQQQNMMLFTKMFWKKSQVLMDIFN
jgi:hypothetical protein